MKKYYHVTLKKNLQSIMNNGLIPQVGNRSKELNEEECVFLFSNIEDMDIALSNWLGTWYNEEYGEEVDLVSLEINLPNNFPITNSSVKYEKISKKIIPSIYIKYLKDE